MSDVCGLSADDVVAINAVIMKYGFLIDDREFDRLDEVFTKDANVDYRPGGSGPFSGLAEIRRQMDLLEHPVQHMLVSHVIDSVSDEGVVVRSKALFPLPNGVIANHAYRDVLVRTADGWRIKDKTTYGYQ